MGSFGAPASTRRPAPFSKLLDSITLGSLLAGYDAFSSSLRLRRLPPAPIQVIGVANDLARVAALAALAECRVGGVSEGRLRAALAFLLGFAPEPVQQGWEISEQEPSSDGGSDSSRFFDWSAQLAARDRAQLCPRCAVLWLYQEQLWLGSSGESVIWTDYHRDRMML